MRWIISILFFLIFQWYSYQAIKTFSSNRWILFAYFLFVIMVVGNLIFYTLILDRSTTNEPKLMYAIGFFLSLFVFQILVTIFLMGEDIFRIPQGIYAYFSKIPDQNQFLPQRRKLISQIAVGLAAIPFTSLLYGMFRGKYNFKVLTYELEYDDLPEAFEGFKITQISDIHSGSFDNAKKVQYGVDLVNAQGSDVVFFTGDLVNNKAEEILPWIETFKKINSKHGVYSVLGNHDYGDYMRWESPEAKKKNMQALEKAQKQMGWDLLLNQSRFIEKDGQRIAVIGVENWGSRERLWNMIRREETSVSMKCKRMLVEDSLAIDK